MSWVVAGVFACVSVVLFRSSRIWRQHAEAWQECAETARKALEDRTGWERWPPS